jgi:hypothetical protein
MSELFISQLLEHEKKPSLDRRNFLKLSGLGSAALILGFTPVDGSGKSQIASVNKTGDSYKLSPYIIIEKSGKITLMNPKPDMGQGTYQSVPSLIAEELEVTLEKVDIQQTGGEKEFGRQVSGGIPPNVMPKMQRFIINQAAKNWPMENSSKPLQNWKYLKIPNSRIPKNSKYSAKAIPDPTSP